MDTSDEESELGRLLIELQEGLIRRVVESLLVEASHEVFSTLEFEIRYAEYAYMSPKIFNLMKGKRWGRRFLEKVDWIEEIEIGIVSDLWQLKPSNLKLEQ